MAVVFVFFRVCVQVKTVSVPKNKRFHNEYKGL